MMERQHYYYDDHEKTMKIPRAADLATKQEGNEYEYGDAHHHHIHIHDEIEKAKAPLIPLSSSSSSCSSKPNNNMAWIRLKDPRIVRVSKACGGKDRHSKVCTVRGLRDRRVRLSVPTALQLFDLQEKLGFNQPSKVIDWLLEAAKHDINDLPPLPPLNLSLLHHHAILSSRSHPTHHHHSNSFWKLVHPTEASNDSRDHDHHSSPHHKPINNNNVVHDQDDDHRLEDIEEEEEDQVTVVHDQSDHQVLPRHHHNVSSSSFGGFLNSSVPVPLGYQQWQPNAATTTTTSTADDHDVSVSNNNNVVPLSLSMSMTTNYDHHSHFGNMGFEDVVARQMNQYQYHHMLASTTTTPSLCMTSMGMASHSQSLNLKPLGLRMITPNTTITPTQGFPSK